LIAHPNEYRYTVAGIAEYLQRLDMRSWVSSGRSSIGTLTGRRIQMTHATSRSGPRSSRANPDAFENLYDVWTIKP
jgi:hypothetical protein